MSTVDEGEASKFAKLSDQWWDKHGKFKVLHEINALRLEFIKSRLELGSAVSVLDVGCGGGLISIPLAESGYSVTGIDPVLSNISVAASRADSLSLSGICFLGESIEEFVDKHGEERFDAVLALEVVEHAADLNLFLQLILKTVKPGGKLFISTISRNVKSYLLAILGAEYVLRWLPIGTHSWSKFVNPSELCAYLRSESEVEEIVGMSFNPFKRIWQLNDDPSVNYIAVFGKK